MQKSAKFFFSFNASYDTILSKEAIPLKFNSTPTRIYSIDENGKLVAEITFPTADGKIYCINHTFVDNSLRGQGIADQLMRAAVDKIHGYHGTITATCSYAVKWLQEHPEYL